MLSMIKSRKPPRFTAESLNLRSAVELKQYSKIWGGSGNERKERCIEVIFNSLDKPEIIKEHLKKLTAMDTTALWILKEHGGLMTAGELEQILKCYGHDIGVSTSSFYGMCVYVPQLIKRGLLLWDTADYYFSTRRGEIRGDTLVWTDERILAQLTTPPKIHPLDVRHILVAPDAATYRRPSHLLMDCLAITRAIQQMQGLRLTREDTVRVTNLRKFVKLLGWENGVSYEGYAFPNIAQTVLFNWLCCGWLVKSNGALELTITPDYFNTQPEEEIVSLMMGSFWADPIVERYSSDYWFFDVKDNLAVELLSCLRALPDMSQAYTVPHFAEAVYQRVEQDENPLRPRPSHIKHREKNAETRKSEWIGLASKTCEELLTGWMYWLGLVALQTLPTDELVFRFTDLGQRVMGYDVRKKATKKVAEAEGPAWIVQPNFDVIVYLNNVTQEQLAFLEMHGERQQAEMHTACYILTRESIHRGLDAGTTIEKLIATLRAGADAELPQNVEREIRSWAQLREQITIYNSGRIIAFDSCQERDRALQSGLLGRPIGELYVLAPQNIELPQLFLGVFSKKTPSIAVKDYAQPPLHCIHLGEDGSVVIDKETVDLLLEGQLARCTELFDNVRLITPDSLKKVKQAGVSATNFITFLQGRAINEIPGLLEVMIRNNLGTHSKAEGMQAYALRVTDKRLYTALTSSRSLADYILDVPGPDTILIPLDKVPEFLEVMEELGVRIEGYGDIEDRPDWLDVMKYAKQYMRVRGSW